jgi:hypothetical protein
MTQAATSAICHGFFDVLNRMCLLLRCFDPSEETVTAPV